LGRDESPVMTDYVIKLSRNTVERRLLELDMTFNDKAVTIVEM